MNLELPLLESKYEQLKTMAATAKIKGDWVAANKSEIMANQCFEKIMEYRSLNGNGACGQRKNKSRK